MAFVQNYFVPSQSSVSVDQYGANVYPPPTYPPPGRFPGETSPERLAYDHGYNGYMGGPQVNPHHASPSRRRSSNSFPYPVSQHDPAARSPTRSRFNTAAPQYPDVSQSSSSTLRVPRKKSVILSPERSNRKDRRESRDENHTAYTITPLPKLEIAPVGPSNHILVPQSKFAEPISSRSHVYRYPEVTFQMNGFPEIGMKVSSIIKESPSLLAGHNDEIFKDVPERELKVQIIWPGYTSHPFEKRLKTQRGTLTRGVVAFKLANMVLDFAAEIQQTRTVIERGYEQWVVGDRKMGLLDARDVFITKLVNCGGSHWQMELWVPRRIAPSTVPSHPWH
ncbi:hypothetical protein M413DRAFT_445955 [Hebeloma cylindrosporum]|uniref:Uncharacterized protein n=1 Tax=Hebeloma cylindrosporum TaxID=76867 RepID=A0A0C3C8E6_HEBCY|nr:hypothetical protein M413DRAFT_445955 [Hebeloma cylindrosporum h7]